jgi:RNA polymerase I-specific transcription initiation factor RRN3
MVSRVPMAPIQTKTASAAPSNPTSVLRKTAIRRTLADAGFDDDMSEIPTKRRRQEKKVEFDPHVQSRIMDDSIFEKDLGAVRLEVRTAIQAHLKGDSEGYDVLKEVFSLRANDPDAPTAVSLRTHLLALTGCVSLLNRNCSGLVKAVLNMEWLGREESFVKIYVQFLGNLTSAQGSFVGLVLGMLVDKFSGGMLISPSISSPSG